MPTSLLPTLAESLGVSVEEAAEQLELLVSSLRRQVREDGSATLPGLGTFKTLRGTLVLEPAESLVQAANVRYGGLEDLQAGAPDDSDERDDIHEPEAEPAAAEDAPFAPPAPVPATESTEVEDAERTPEFDQEADEPEALAPGVPEDEPEQFDEPPAPVPPAEVPVPDGATPEADADVTAEATEADDAPVFDFVDVSPTAREAEEDEPLAESAPVPVADEERDGAEDEDDVAAPVPVDADADLGAPEPADDAPYAPPPPEKRRASDIFAPPDLSEPEPMPPPPMREPERRDRSRLVPIVGLALVVLAAAVAYFVLFRSDDGLPVAEGTPPEQPADVVTQPPPAAASDAAAADSAAAAPVEAVETPAEPEPEPEPEPEAPPESIDPSRGGFTIVLASSGSRQLAEQELRRYQNLDQPVAVLPGRAGNVTRYRIVLGQYATQEAARAALTSLQNRLPAGAWILRIPRG